MSKLCLDHPTPNVDRMPIRVGEISDDIVNAILPRRCV